MTTISGYYQLPENIQPAGSELIDVELIDDLTGDSLIDPLDQLPLTGDIQETVVTSNEEDIISIVFDNTDDSPVQAEVTNRLQSEVEVSLLGIPRTECALGLFDAVNIYGINTKEFYNNLDRVADYAYWRDPSDWTFDENYGYFCRHISAESALQAYSFPPPVSFTYPVDDNTGRFPGGYTDGFMRTFWESKRAFRYQPGRVTAFTFGVRMSTGSDYSGEVVRWGCRNYAGTSLTTIQDGYYFELRRGDDLYIVRQSPDLGTLEIPRSQWNGDPVIASEGSTSWTLDLSRVTMFKIEFSWYGAVGAKFLAYVPIGNNEARWVTLHYLIVENQNVFPSLRNPFLRLFVEAQTTAGATSPAFINLYGSSVYIDGGDIGTVTTGSAAIESPKPIDTTPRSILGIQTKGTINNVTNRKIIFPNNLSVYSSVDARFDLVFQDNSTCGQESYFFGNGTRLTASSATSIPVIRTSANTLTTPSGQFFPDISAELDGDKDFLTGRKVKIVGTNIFANYVTAISADLTTITTEFALPSTVTSITLGRMNNYAVSSGTIESGVTEGTIFRAFTSGYCRIGLLPNASGVSYNPSTDAVLWFASQYPGLSLNRSGQIIGEQSFPRGCNQTTNFAITFPSSGLSTISAGGKSLTISGSPYPLRVVVEGHAGSVISDIVIAREQVESRLTPGSGSTEAQAIWPLLSGYTESYTAAGGSSYVANKFENTLADPLSAALVDRQGLRVLRGGQRVASYFVAAGESREFSLKALFGPDKMFITGIPGGIQATGALFVVASARSASGEALANINWEEQ